MIGQQFSPSTLGVRPAPALVQQLLVGAFAWMFAGLAVTAGVSFLVATSPGLTAAAAGGWLVLVIVQVGLAIGIQALINRISATAALGLFLVYAASMGLTVGIIVQLYTGATVVGAFVSSSAMFGAAAVYGATTKRSLASLGGLLFMATIGIVVASLVNLLLASSTLGWIISLGGVALFTALTAYDVQRITNGELAALTTSRERASVLAALHLYLNFINLFLFMLRLMGGRRD